MGGVAWAMVYQAEAQTETGHLVIECIFTVLLFIYHFNPLLLLLLFANDILLFDPYTVKMMLDQTICIDSLT